MMAFLDHTAVTAQADLAAHYVAAFDPKRRRSPYLTYYDTRKRAGGLLRFEHAMRAAGFEVADGRLPDHVAVVCELSARGGVREARRLLRER
ncbi:nitrate reductase molybdenum cofactor assembly chaperone [Nonomuraea sp. NPDC049269]|uniref:nitrate reductase molybdenum cofactor assembly chaperone n=1 Tax=Nonomuraea sp. NPDC049269 TaxID=3364349 RepID=UPI00371098B5